MMNVFFLSTSPEATSTLLCDQHVLKMMVEYTQLISGALRLSGVDAGYKLTHQNHPCAIWARTCRENLIWLWHSVHYLNYEYKNRYGAVVDHRSYTVARGISHYIDTHYPTTSNGGVPTMPPLVMPEIYRVPVTSLDDVISAYTKFYKEEKLKFAKWRMGVPWLFQQEFYRINGLPEIIDENTASV